MHDFYVGHTFSLSLLDLGGPSCHVMHEIVPVERPWWQGMGACQQMRVSLEENSTHH